MLFEGEKNNARLVIFNPSVLNNRMRVYPCPLDRLKRRKCKKCLITKLDVSSVYDLSPILMISGDKESRNNSILFRATKCTMDIIVRWLLSLNTRGSFLERWQFRFKNKENKTAPTLETSKIPYSFPTEFY